MNKVSPTCLLLWFGLVAHGEAQTFTLSAVADTYLKSGSANQNQGSDTFLRIQSSGNNRSLVRFDSAAIAAAVGNGSLASARLELYIQSNSNNWSADGRTVDAHALTANWTEPGATWSCAIDSNPANSRIAPPNGPAGTSPTTLPTPSSRRMDARLDSLRRHRRRRGVPLGTPNYGWIVKKSEDGAERAGRIHVPRGHGRSHATAGPGGGERGARPGAALPRHHFAQPADPGQRSRAGGDGGVFGRRLGGRSRHPPGAGRRAGRHGGLHPGPQIGESAIAPNLAAGNHAVQALVRDHAGNAAQASAAFQLLLGPGPHLVILPAVGDTYLREGDANRNSGAEPDPPRPRERYRTAPWSSSTPRASPPPSPAPPWSRPRSSCTSREERPQLGQDGRTVDAHRLTAAWTERGATWDCPNDSQPDEPGAGLRGTMGRRQLRAGAHGQRAPHPRPRRLGDLRRHRRRAAFAAAHRTSAGCSRRATRPRAAGWTTTRARVRRARRRGWWWCSRPAAVMDTTPPAVAIHTPGDGALLRARRRR